MRSDGGHGDSLCSSDGKEAKTLGDHRYQFRRIEKARKLISVQEGEKYGIELYYINPETFPDPAPVLLAITNEKGYDDVFVYAPPKNVAELGNRIMAMDGCMNIYAATADKKYRAGMNIYGSHT